jgi:urease accessory protein UreH
MSTLPDLPPRPSCCSLVFSAAHPDRTVLAHATAAAPWRVVRAAGARCCEATLVQTQGGMLDGDRWRVDVHALRDSHVRLRGLGATLAHRGAAAARTRLRVAGGASLSWRSPGLIPMDGARVRLTTVVDVAASGSAAVSELIAVPGVCDAVLRVVVLRDGVVLYEERTRFDRDPRAPWRLGAATHLGTAVAVTPHARDCARHWHAALRGCGAAVSPHRGLVVARALGSSLQEVDAALGPLVEAGEFSSL